MKYIEIKRTPIDYRLRNFILKRDNYMCRYCGNKKEPFHLDHVYPVAKGGETSIENLATACSRCNSIKHTSIMFPKPIGYFEKRTGEVSIVNVLFVATRVSFVASGYVNYEYFWVAKAFFLVGLAILLISLARMATGKN